MVGAVGSTSRFGFGYGVALLGDLCRDIATSTAEAKGV